jgi:hypothetical protein
MVYGWQMNPGNWNWNIGKTWGGLGLGAIAGAAAGIGFYYAAPTLAGTNFFTHFGTSGTIAAYTLTGGATLGAGGYAAGFAGGMIYSGGDWAYANQSGLFGLAIGSSIGGILGASAGTYEAFTHRFQYERKLRIMKKELKPEVNKYVGNDVRRSTYLRLNPKINYPAQTIGMKGEINTTNEYYNGFQGQRAKIEISRDMIDMYFSTDKMRAVSAYVHEWFHASDYYYGRDVYYTKYGGMNSSNYLEMMAYGRTYDIYGRDMGRSQIEDYMKFTYYFLFFQFLQTQY